MIRHLIPLLAVFAILTGPNGRTIFIAKSNVVAVSRPAKGECDPDAHAKVYTASQSFCVAEDEVDAARKIGEE